VQETAVPEAQTRLPEEPTPDVPPVAWRPVSAVAGALALLLLLTSGRYGFFGDELYYRAAGRNLGGGLADQPPLVPLVAHAMDLLFGDSVVGSRLPVIALSVTGSILTALITREMGGGRVAQLLAIITYAVSPFFLYGAGHTMSTQSFDSFFWTLVCWLVVRWVRVRDNRLLLYAGLATAVGVQAKVLLPVFWVALGVSVLIFGPRDMLRKPQLWIGAVIAAAALVPFALWQQAHGWPQAEMAQVVAKEVAAEGNGPKTFFWIVFGSVAGLAGAVMACLGVIRLFTSPGLRTYRFLGLTAAGVMLAFWINDGRPFYVAGVLAVCWAAAGIEVERRHPRRWLWAAAPIFLASAALSVSDLPVLPISHYANVPYSKTNMHVEEVGWPQLADAVARGYRQVPPAERATTVLMGGHYWIAAALDQYGPERGLPKSYSPFRGYWYVGGTPPDSARTVLTVGLSDDKLASMFTSCRQVDKVDNGQHINNGEQGMPVYLCENPRQPWSKQWPTMRSMAD
jgi:4-amino-4-deoxy-L-arabinose transferase-like glycosyltransferase